METRPADMTDAELIEVVIARLQAQGSQAMIDVGYGIKCVYRTADGRGCGVGVLLPDEMARRADMVESEDGTGIGAISEALPDVAKWLGTRSRQRLTLLQKVQMVHDSKLSWAISGLTYQAVITLRELSSSN